MDETTTTPRTIAATVAQLPASAAQRFADKPCARRKVGEEWQTVDYREVCAAIDEIALGLVALGIEVGDRVGILCDTRLEWTLCSYGISAAGGIVVPVYPTNAPSECEWVLGDAGVRAILCEDAGQVAKIESIRERLPALQHVIAIDGEQGDLTLAALRASGRGGDREQLRDRQERVAPDDTYTIIYTSGTTGPPKGVVLSHRNAMSICVVCEKLGFVTPDENIYLFLPLAHVFALTAMLAAFDQGTAIIYYGGDTKQILPELMATQPTYIPSVPRIFEKLYTAALKMRDAGSAEDRARFDGAIELGVQVRQLRERGQDVPAELQAAFDSAEENLYGRVRALFGGRLRQAVSAAAPIAPEILRFFWACGVPVLEGWGLTETSALGTVATLEHYRFGTIGRAVPDVEVATAADGEILVRGPNVFQEYWNNPEATAEALVDGWLHTGDLGSIDDDGYVSITGRKKEIIITAGGKNLTPANIENDLKQSPFISQAVMHGDRRPYPVVLITLDPEEIVPWAQERGLGDDLARLAVAPEVTEIIQGELDRANANYAQVEQVKRFAILSRDLSIEEGELTPTLKVKRSVVSERYAGVLDDLYGGPLG